MPRPRPACTSCKKLKIACNNQEPCNQCLKRTVKCVFPHPEKRRPVNRGLTDALETQISLLKHYIAKLVVASPLERDEMLAKLRSDQFHSANPEVMPTSDVNPNSRKASVSEVGQRFDVGTASPGHFFGPTSVAAMAAPRAAPAVGSIDNQDGFQAQVAYAQSKPSTIFNVDIVATTRNSDDLPLIFDPQSKCCRDMMILFFDKIYTQNMCLYREYFLRAYDQGGGPYYSDLLMYAICAMGGLVGTVDQQDLSELFARQCEAILYGEELEYTRFTTIQALLLMGTRAIGRGKDSKGWLFTGMAFRMIHEMGLHQDPAHIPNSSELEKEVFRRVYWAAFVIDKQLSMFFGRPPALQPREANVRDTIRIAYPEWWRAILQKYMGDGKTETEYEDGFALVSAFVQKAELCKIIHKMMTEVFTRSEPIEIETSVQEIHTALQKWRDEIPSNAHWNPHVKNTVQQYTINLHMLYHTAMMTLHRPLAPLRPLDASERRSLKICHDSLEMIFHLLKAIGKEYKYLPFTFVHTAATAASIILIERDVDSLEQDRTESDRQLRLLVDVLDSVAPVWTSAIPIRDAISSLLSGSASGDPLAQSVDYDLLANGLGYEQMMESHDLEPFTHDQLDEFLDLGFTPAGTSLEEAFLDLDYGE